MLGRAQCEQFASPQNTANSNAVLLAGTRDSALTDFDFTTGRRVFEFDDSDCAIDVDFGDPEIANEVAAIADGENPTRLDAIAASGIDFRERSGFATTHIDDGGR